MQTPELPAGPELDALIAERVFGLTVVKAQPFAFTYAAATGRATIRRDAIPAYSTDIAAAWQVVDAMVALVEATQYTAENLEWRGPLYKPSHHYLTHEGYPLGTVCWYVHAERFGWRRSICADTPMLAICRAALAVQSAEAMRPPRP